MNIEKYTKKLVGNDEERAVSPVIGVILMVAITVILAAVIAAFVLDLGQSTGANPQAGITFDEGSGEVTATVNSIERLDGINGNPSGSDCDFSGLSASVGSTDTDSSCTSGDTIIIVGEYDGDEAVIAEYEVQNA